MFIDFQFANFRSFRDLQKFSLQASPTRSNDNGVGEDHVFETSGFRLLKTKSIYGSNASGKSNLIKAINEFVKMVIRSVSDEGMTKEIWDKRFKLINDWDEQPVFFQYTFLVDEMVYRYGFQISEGLLSHEWLYGGVSSDEKLFFMRSPAEFKIEKENFRGGEYFLEQLEKGDSELFRSDSLFLTAAALNGNKIAAQLRSSIMKLMIMDGVSDGIATRFALHILEKGDDIQKKAIRDFLCAADTGISDIEIQEVSDNNLKRKFLKSLSKEELDSDKNSVVGLFSKHAVYDENGAHLENISVPFGEWESEGTRKLFSIGSLIIESLTRGGVLIVDEFDARFHPNLTSLIVKLYQDKETNPLNSQLIFVTHDASLQRRSKLRRDEICFVNKDKYGISFLRTLVEFKGVRKDASYDKEYLDGTYNAVPYLEKIRSVITSLQTEE